MNRLVIRIGARAFLASRRHRSLRESNFNRDEEADVLALPSEAARAGNVMSSRKTVAYLGHPHFGGTFTVFRMLLVGLEPFGVDVRWVGAGPAAAASAKTSEFSKYADFGDAVAG